MLRTKYWRTPALQPDMSFIDKKAPGKVRRLKTVWTNNGGLMLVWNEPKSKSWRDTPIKYIVYRFAPGEKINTEDVSKIVDITPYTFYMLPGKRDGQKYTYVVTSINRLHNESSQRKLKIRL
jgi:hypothetical protein